MRRRGKKVNPGKAQISRERTRLGKGQEMHSHREPVSLGGVMPVIMKKLGLESQQWLDTLENEWGAVVGEDVAKHARPGRFEDGHLVVFVDSSVWMSELSRYGKDKILNNIRERFGTKKIRSISLQLDPDWQS
jgi:predicted nucleic acid-binding Zn ribbon protein